VRIFNRAASKVLAVYINPIQQPGALTQPYSIPYFRLNPVLLIPAAPPPPPDNQVGRYLAGPVCRLKAMIDRVIITAPSVAAEREHPEWFVPQPVRPGLECWLCS